MRKVFIALFFISLPLILQSQTAEEFYRLSLNKNRVGMYVLGGWAVANIITGSYGWAAQRSSSKYFYQMNTMWNVVNLGIAGFAMYEFHSTDISLLNPVEMLQKHMTYEKLFLINAGLDILYIGAGAYLIHRSGISEKNSDRYLGYGRSVILQGAFLFAFDLLMYFVQYNHRINFRPILENLSLRPGEISLLLNF